MAKHLGYEGYLPQGLPSLRPPATGTLGLEFRFDQDLWHLPRGGCTLLFSGSPAAAAAVRSHFGSRRSLVGECWLVRRLLAGGSRRLATTRLCRDSTASPARIALKDRVRGVYLTRPSSSAVSFPGRAGPRLLSAILPAPGIPPTCLVGGPFIGVGEPEAASISAPPVYTGGAILGCFCL